MSTTTNTAARNAIDAAIEALMTRRGTTSDANEKATINNSIIELQDQRDALDGADLDAAARAVASATAALGDSVAAARVGPFDSYLAAMHTAIGTLQNVHADAHASIRLPRTDAPAADPPPAAPLAAPAVAPVPLPPVGTGTDPQALAGEYLACFDACQPAADQLSPIAWFGDNVVKSRGTYAHVGAGLGIPWYFIGLLHGMECGFNFGTHLHNGDPLLACTVNDPKGRPPTNPPFTWSDSALDALTLEHFTNQTDWSLPMVLFRLERYNGFGYRRQGLRTPYLWSFSNLYSRGKYVADGRFDPHAVSKQCGAAVALRRLVVTSILRQQPDQTLI
jgi:lysozyme family protein